MQTTLLGLAIAFILALVAALAGPYFIDWNQFRPQFEAEASKVIGAPVRVAGALDARLLPTPTLRLRSVTLGGADDLGRIRADKLDVEFSLGELMRGGWRANELSVDGLALDLGLDPQGKVDWPAWNGTFNFASLTIDRLNLTGRIALHDAASRSTLELNDIAFSGEVRSLAGAVHGDGHFTVEGARYPFRVSSGQSPDGNATRVHLNIDPGQRPIAVDAEGLLSFDARAPKFDGMLVLSTPAKKGDEGAAAPWRVSAKVKADHAAAQLEQIEVSYGAEERAMKLAGLGDLRFGASPQLRAVLSARQLDADRFLVKDGKDDSKDVNAAAPVRMLSALLGAMAEMPPAPIRTRIEASTEQITLGGRPIQNVSLAMRGDGASWAIDRLDMRAPGTTQVSFTNNPKSSAHGNFAGTLNVDCADPDALLAWLQGRGDVVRRTQKPLRLVGDVSISEGRIAIDALNAEIDGGAIEGSVALLAPRPPRGTRLEATLKAERLDLDAASASIRSLAGPDASWPDEAAVSLDIARALSAGQELKPFAIKIGYDPKTVTLDRLQIGQSNGMSIQGAGRFDRAGLSGSLALDSTMASLDQLATAVAPVAPSVAERLKALQAGSGAAHAKLKLDLARTKAAPSASVAANAELAFDAPQLRGQVSMQATPSIEALRGLDLNAISRSHVDVEAKLSAEHGDALLALLGLDRSVSAGGSVQFEGSVGGVWREPLRLSARLWGSSIDAELQGTLEPWSQAPKASVNLRARSLNLAPMFGLKPSDPLAQNIRLFARASLAGNKLTLDDIDSVGAGSRLRGHLVVALDEERAVDGAVGLDSLDLAPAFALAIGAAGHDASEPLGAALLKGWHGRIAFQALRGVLPGGGELRPVSGAIKSDGQSLTLEALKGRIGGGEATATIDARPDPNGIIINSRLDFSGVDGTALRYRGLKMPSGHSSLQMTLMSRGRSVAALEGALSGSGTMTLESASIPGLDPRAFEVAIRASDSGQPTDDNLLKQIVAPVLAAGNLPVASAQIPFNIRDGRLRVDATTLDAGNAHVIVSGGYDMLADQADIRVSLSANSVGSAASRPEIQIFAAGMPDALTPILDVTSLSSWLAVRVIDRETRRLDAIERGEAPPVETPAVAPSTAALPIPAPAEIPLPGRDPRRLPPKGVVAPRPPAALAAPLPPVVSQQAAPLPPPIELRPLPGQAPAKPRAPPRPPMVPTAPASPQP
ncbi:MAG: AsmA family protein [Bradyrhizobium sp.]|nr:AsmA family protein [Bradyrhizobium sp.]